MISPFLPANYCLFPTDSGRIERYMIEDRIQEGKIQNYIAEKAGNFAVDRRKREPASRIDLFYIIFSEKA